MLTFEELQDLEQYLLKVRLTHVPSLLHYFIESGPRFYHQVPKEGRISRASTATCISSLVRASLWSANKKWWCATAQIAQKMLEEPWTSSGLPDDNPFTVSFIAEAILHLERGRPGYDGYKENCQKIARAADILLEKFSSSRTGGISIDPYPPSAYLTQLSYRVLRRMDRADEELKRRVHDWASAEVNKQVALLSAGSRSANSLNLAYALILVADEEGISGFSSDERTIFTYALRQFFAQAKEGTWPLSRICSSPVRRSIWGRFGAELTIHKEMIDAVTGDSIQASGAPASRPQPTEPRREGRVDPNAVAAA